MAGPAVEIHGARELRKSLRQAGADIKELKTVNKQAGEVVKSAAASTAPVGPVIKKAKVRRLRDTLAVFATQTSARIRAGAKSVPYANPVHWGWFRRGIKPNPWISKQAQSTEPKWLSLYEQHIDKMLDKIKGA